MHCCGETARLVAGRGGDWLFALKRHRSATFRDVADYFADPKAVIHGTCETTSGDHGRIETRRHAVVHDVGWLFPDESDPARPPMPGLAAIGRIEAQVERDGKTSTSLRCYLSSAKLSAEAFADAVRAHWRIESVPQRHTERSSP